MSSAADNAVAPALGPSFHPCPPDPSCPHCNGPPLPAAERLDWSFLDAAYCISLRTRDDRAAGAAAQFHKVGLCRKVIFYRPERHPRKGFIGSWESHRAVAIEALARGFARTAIFEDDVLFGRTVRPRTLRAIGRALDALPPDWMIFYLGHWPLWTRFVRHNVLRTTSGCAHAYIASPRLLLWLRDHPWGTPGVAKRRIVGKGLDAAFAELPGTYALFPMLATQRVSPSDNLTARQKAKRDKFRLRHLVTHTRHREWLLSHLMRPAEIMAVLVSPMVMLAQGLRGAAARLAAWLAPLVG